MKFIFDLLSRVTFAFVTNHMNVPDGRIIDVKPAMGGSPQRRMRYPTDGPPKITSPYGVLRKLPRMGVHRHIGVDMIGATTRVFAPASGRIVNLQEVDEQYPNMYRGNVPEGRGRTPYVTILTEDGDRIVLKHLRLNPTYTLGDFVKIGDLIGNYGDYGRSYGAHLHYEFWPAPKGSERPILTNVSFGPSMEHNRTADPVKMQQRADREYENAVRAFNKEQRPTREGVWI